VALTAYQREVCQLLAASRVERGESYVAGGAALNTLLSAPRLSHDIDLFHDTEAALARTWDTDRDLLSGAGFGIEVVRERPGFVHAVVRRGQDAVALQWVRDSAFRFFPLVTHPELGLTMHPFDLATNKVLALVGRLEVRDWVDAIECSQKVQHLGYLAWAACGKDPGYGPGLVLSEAARSSRYSRLEVEALAFEGPPPDAAELSQRWRQILREAAPLVDALPGSRVGCCVLTGEGELYRGGLAKLCSDLSSNAVRFHTGTVCGAFPQLA